MISCFLLSEHNLWQKSIDINKSIISFDNMYTSTRFCMNACDELLRHNAKPLVSYISGVPKKTNACDTYQLVEK